MGSTSCRNYEPAAAEADSRGDRPVGVDGVPRVSFRPARTKLRELQERDLSGEDVVALVLDARKTFAEATMVVALGITVSR